MGTISEKTKIPVSLVITIVLLTFWLSGVSFQGMANGKDVDDLKKKQEKYDQMVTDIAVIKAEVHEIKQRIGP